LNIQKLLRSGYNLQDIRELLALFLANINESKKIVAVNNNEQIILTIHKLKGGLIMLGLTGLIDSCALLEEKVKVYGVTSNKKSIKSLLDNCLSESIAASKELEILISNDGMNS
jgi:HPt (histidine-containing phosphotransfer) domain-containing protein